MEGMKERKGAFENKYALDEELRFKAGALRNRLLGMWVAEKLGKTGDDAIAYAKAIIMTALKHGYEEDVLTKIEEDMADANVEFDGDEIRELMTSFMSEAVERLQGDVKKTG